MKTDVGIGNKRELLKPKWQLKKRCDKETHLLITESTEVAWSAPPKRERGGSMAMKERERERDRGVWALQTVVTR